MIKKCVLCGDYLEDRGYHAFPLANTGECCEDCYSSKVVPYKTLEARIISLFDDIPEPTYREFENSLRKLDILIRDAVNTGITLNKLNWSTSERIIKMIIEVLIMNYKLRANHIEED